MENEQVFTATTNLDALAKAPPSLYHRGHDTAKAAADGIDILDPPENERSSLLGRTKHAPDAPSEAPANAQDGNDDSWIGDGELLQRPWWNRPSVSV